MSEIDVLGMVKDMLEAASKVLKDEWPKAKTYAEMEFKKLGETIVTIQKAKLAGELDEEDARILIDMQKNAMRSVIVTLSGLGIIAVEKAINAALGAIRDTVNAALSWPLL